MFTTTLMNEVESSLLKEFPSTYHFNEKIARLLKSNDAAMVLNRVMYWLDSSIGKEMDGRRWVYNTMDEWLDQFTNIGESKLSKIFQRLRKMGILIVGNYNLKRYDRTLWYSVDKVKLVQLLADYEASNPPCPKKEKVVPINKKALKKANSEIVGCSDEGAVKSTPESISCTHQDTVENDIPSGKKETNHTVKITAPIPKDYNKDISTKICLDRRTTEVRELTGKHKLSANKYVRSTPNNIHTLEAEYGKEVVSRAKAEVDEKVQKGLLQIKKSATAYLTGMLRNLRLEGKMWKYMSSTRLEAESVVELENQARSRAVTERLVQDAVHRKEVAKYYSSNYQQEMARLDTLPVDMPEEPSIPKMEYKTILPKTTEEHLKDAKNIINAMLGGLIPELP